MKIKNQTKAVTVLVVEYSHEDRIFRKYAQVNQEIYLGGNFMKKKILGLFLMVGVISFAVEERERTIHNEEYFKIRETLSEQNQKIFDNVIHESFNKIEFNQIAKENILNNVELSENEKKLKVIKYNSENEKIQKEIEIEMEKFKKYKVS